MRSVSQRVDDQVIQIFEKRGGGIRQRTEIGEICRAAEAKAEHPEIAVQQRHGNNLHAHQLEWAMDNVEVDARNGALRGRVVKNIGKGAANHAKRFFRAVHGERGFLANVEGANIVEAEDVVGVAVGEEDGVEAIEADAEGLLAKVGRGVDDDVLAVARKQ